MVSSETAEQTDDFAMGLMRTIGIAPGLPFEPDDRMQALLIKAAQTGQVMARTIAHHGDEADRWHWPDRRYGEAFMGGSPAFVTDGHANHDARTAFFYLACGTSSLMATTKPGPGQAYPWAVQEADGNIFDDAKIYKNYWSVTAYDTGTRSRIHNGEPFSRVSTYAKPLVNADGSTDLFFGHQVPTGAEANWARTVRGQDWFLLFRLHSPQQPYFDLSWKPDDLVPI